MIVATFGPSTAWAGKTISYEDGRFLLEGFGPITAGDILEYDRQGHLRWPYDGMRVWVRGVGASPAPAPAAHPAPSSQPRKLPGWAIALIVVAVFVLLMPLLAAMAIPMYYGQKAKADEASLRQGVHSLEVGVQNWAVAHDGRPPRPALVTPSGLEGYVDDWPVNPYTEAPMTQGTNAGDFRYLRAPNGHEFQIIAFGEDGAPITAVP